jgi:hypothetical protein
MNIYHQIDLCTSDQILIHFSDKIQDATNWPWAVKVSDSNIYSRMMNDTEPVDKYCYIHFI